ncbi:MAG: hypothetical protein HY958_05750 [Bacteroidia bacterium]|nr:hypothetical protein [Bacteroidia bacterium]
MIVSGQNKILKELGYYDDQKGIIKRYYNEAGGWNRHLENTKKYILKSAESKAKNSIAILGSGWLLDVPIKELSGIFGAVYLFDIIHPREIKQKIKKYHNVKLIECDISGGAIDGAYRVIHEYKKNKTVLPLPGIALNGFQYNMDFDMVVSLNILNQLDIIVSDYLKKFNVYSNSDISDFKKRIQSKHIETLPEGKTCLITDFEEKIYCDAVFENKNPLIFATLPKGESVEYWEWEFDMTGNYYKGKKTIFNVIAMNW